MSPAGPPGPDGPVPRKTRTRTGCLNCRKKKRKCDEQRPTCGACHRRTQICEWGLKVSFRAENAQGLDGSHPSMKCMARRRPREYEILDITAEIIREYISSPGIEGQQDQDQDGDMDMDVESGGPSHRLQQLRKQESSISADSSSSHVLKETIYPRRTPYQTSPDNKQHYHHHHHHSNHHPSPATSSLVPQVTFSSPQDQFNNNTGLQSPSVTNNVSPISNRHADSAVASLLSLSQGGGGGGHHLSSTREQSGLSAPDSMNISLSPSYVHDFQGFNSDGGGSGEDGVFLPGSAYHEWHSTLRNHLIQEVRSNVPTRAGTPHLETSQQYSDEDSSQGLQQRSSAVPESQSGSGGGGSDGSGSLINASDECILWRNWFDEVAPWLDKFDNQRHFQHIIPTMVPGHSHLRLSILALSARQMELKGTTSSQRNISLALYQEAIHQLLPHLPERSTAVIASCVILCVLEMLSCSPKAWQRHLDGCASLMEAVGINGFVGGVEQALFWVFARMDVCGGLISSVKTLIPVSHWASKMNIEADVESFKSLSDFSAWANYAVYLVAQVIDLLMPSTQSSNYNENQILSRNNPKFQARWTQLWRYVCDWSAGRPAPLLPTMTIPSTDPASPFPTIIFSNPAAISGNQLYHTASLLMLQARPPECRLPTPKPRSILWHARRICAISISNDHHGAWTNAIQPLWIAGRCMSNPTEHRAILDLLARIEKESGWGAGWRADDLRAYWGDLEE